MKRWGKHQAAWVAGAKKRPFDKLRRDLLVDTVVVGGGITGLTTALYLSRAGKKVAVLTDGEIGGGTTGYSTGHLTQVLDDDFQSLVSDWGMDSSRLIVDSVTDSINRIESVVGEFGIDCGFERVPGYKFTEEAGQVERLRKDVDVARELGLNVSMVEGNPLRFPVRAVARFQRQAMFDPLRYVYGLAAALEKLGCQIFEESRVVKIEDGEPCNVYTASGNVTASEIVLATHTPVGLYMSLHTRVAPYFSYVLAARLNNPPADGLFWDMHDPYYYLRPYHSGDDLWIIGGRDHKTGQEEKPLERYLELDDYIRDRYDVKEIVNYWGNELYEPVDDLPYIGRIPFTKAIYAGTGYSGTGLTFGTVAGLVISDLILGRENPWASVYDPMRVKPVASAGSFIRENLNVARHFFTDRIAREDLDAVHALPPEEGRVVDLDGKKLAIYRDTTHHIHAFSPTCTHMGCTVHWNGAEKTWDCPCHGGRYKPTGEVFEGPPMEDLKAISLETLESLTPATEEETPVPAPRPPLQPGLNPLGDQFSF